VPVANNALAAVLDEDMRCHLAGAVANTQEAAGDDHPRRLTPISRHGTE
jgi:hypothetical protein